MHILRSYYNKLRRKGAGLKGPLRYQVSRLRGSPDAFLKLCYGGVIHIGAHDGQERFLYCENKLKVVWIEAIPEVYNALLQNIEPYADQKALRALITDRDDETYTFHISSNKGMSSSIYELRDHEYIWPDVHYVSDVVLTSATLRTALARAAIDPSAYEVLVIDTQGSELLVLKGRREDSVKF